MGTVDPGRLLWLLPPWLAAFAALITEMRSIVVGGRDASTAHLNFNAPRTFEVDSSANW